MRVRDVRTNISGEFRRFILISVKCTRQDIFSPVCLSVSVGGGCAVLIEICDSSASYGGPLDECPWAPGLFSSLLGSWLSLGVVSGAGPCLVPLLMTLSVCQLPPPVLFSLLR